MEFEEFATGQIPYLVRMATALAGDVAAAEDLVQEVLIRVHVSWDRIEPLAQPESYVRRMVVNEFLSWRRKWGRILPFADPGRDRVSDVDAEAARADRLLLRSEIARLSRPRQVVLVLRYYAGMTDLEIAEIMGCSPGTVRSHASRALAQLRRVPQLRREYTSVSFPKGPSA